MPDRIREVGGIRILELAAEGAPIITRREVTDLLSSAMSERADMVAIPVARQGEGFFDLKTRLAGEMLQMMVNYGLRVAFIGDMPATVAGSKALRDFIYESNRGRSVWFVPDIGALEQRLAKAA
jgi:hypothetical protein